VGACGRHAAAWRRPADAQGIVSLLVACACRESSPKRGAFRVLLGPSGLHAVSCEYAVDADLSIGMRHMPATRQRRFWLYFNGLDRAPTAPKASVSTRKRPLVKCYLSNTRPKTASRSVQNASLSLPVGACELGWACDGGGHPKVAPSGHSGA